MKKEKYYTANHIENEYNSLNMKQKNNVLYNAIDYMQQYNGRSRFLCIAIAMGYENQEGDSDTYTKASPI